MSTYRVIFSDELYHHGILGQKWGIRRFQNKDGSLTEAGKKRFNGEKKEKKPMSPEQKKKLITAGAIAVGAALGTAGILYGVKIGKLNAAKAAARTAEIAKERSKLERTMMSWFNSPDFKSKFPNMTEEVFRAAYVDI